MVVFLANNIKFIENTCKCIQFC